MQESKTLKILIKLGWVLVMNASLSDFQVNLCLNPNSIRKSYPHLVFCIVGLKVDLEDHFPWIWVHDLAVLRSFTRTHLHTSKNGISAPRSTSSPHLAQTEQVRLTRFFALPDSNTSLRVRISVLGHVVVSQMGIVQVPYATVTVKYFRALISIIAMTMYDWDPADDPW